MTPNHMRAFSVTPNHMRAFSVTPNHVWRAACARPWGWERAARRVQLSDDGQQLRHPVAAVDHVGGGRGGRGGIQNTHSTLN